VPACYPRAVLHDEVRELLRELAAAVGAERVDIVHADAPVESIGPDAPDVLDIQGAPDVLETPDANPRRVPLGNRAYLEIETAPAPERAPESRVAEHSAAVERTVRALRAAGRRWQAERLPAMGVNASEVAPPHGERIRERITVFLEALARTERARAVTVTVQGRVLCSSNPLEELERERLPFLLRRVAVAAGRQSGRSHAEIVDADVYIATFWFDACLVAFFAGPYAVDFFRHRARLVMRELSQLLPMLDEPPPTAASVAPVPPRIPPRQED
jgi:hypothetical protein